MNLEGKSHRSQGKGNQNGNLHQRRAKQSSVHYTPGQMLCPLGKGRSVTIHACLRNFHFHPRSIQQFMQSAMYRLCWKMGLREIF